MQGGGGKQPPQEEKAGRGAVLNSFGTGNEEKLRGVGYRRYRRGESQSSKKGEGPGRF